jgi:hypothetical protein
MVLMTLLTLAAAALGVDADFDGGDADFEGDSAAEPAQQSHASNHSSGGEVTFGAEEKPASELIIAANGQGYETPSEYVSGSNPWDPKK